MEAIVWIPTSIVYLASWCVHDTALIGLIGSEPAILKQLKEITRRDYV
jgi:hypothetical protein